MTTFRTSVVTIHQLAPDIAEVIVDDGVEMTLSDVQAYHDCLLANFSAPFRLLINKINQYTYTYEAQQGLADLPQIEAMAVLVYSKASMAAMRVLQQQQRENPWHAEVFTSRREALAWLDK
ncbi:MULTISPECIES: hypothetical protein [Corallincola]|uniref:STAS/SEC14 domain-containing protein n=3 Tax=Corallincola TaxID=1775176 RepID=A0A368NHG0_9GAMM|nr:MULTISPECIES: hypothetical protein [Corallincola]RCU50002.1 hypothetical protein DU002_10275 [Corallincola holothuriorum]TAA45016.1 hypothetical protein EXY25_12470 [Corallincola spongiicola]TCI03714.1 hypothetical protein EZV61_09225 [Corallincola luteus]